MIGRKVILTMSKQKSHFSDFSAVLQQPLLKKSLKVTSRSLVLSHLPACLCWTGTGIGPGASSHLHVYSRPGQPEPAFWPSVLSRADHSQGLSSDSDFPVPWPPPPFISLLLSSQSLFSHLYYFQQLRPQTLNSSYLTFLFLPCFINISESYLLYLQNILRIPLTPFLFTSLEQGIILILECSRSLFMNLLQSIGIFSQHESDQVQTLPGFSSRGLSPHSDCSPATAQAHSARTTLASSLNHASSSCFPQICVAWSLHVLS